MEEFDNSSDGSYFQQSDFASEDSEPADNEAGEAYRVITSSALSKLQAKAVDTCACALACEKSQAAVVLRHFRWDFDRLMEAVADRDKDNVFTAAGAVSDAGEPVPQDSQDTCPACLEEIQGSEDAIIMDCGHGGCRGCWLQHIQVSIDANRACQLPCMAFRCKTICSHQVVVQLLAEESPDLLQKYERAILNSYIEDNSNVRWCPSVPCCGRAIEALDDGYCEPKCDCGHSFCFKCGSQPHSPATCTMWRQWEVKMCDDSETKNYLKAHSKPCPKCSVPVEKDGGCNLVVCGSCRQPFCWLCGAKTGTAHTWTQIEGHTCGEWKTEADRVIKDSKARHERYMHYYNHYTGHLASLKKETMGATLAELVPKLKTYVSGLVDWSYLSHANCVLLECRRVLSNAYIFAFFMFDAESFSETMSAQENKRLQRLFEDSMSTLTSSVENLSQTLTNEVAGLGIAAREACAENDPGAAAAQSKRAKIDAAAAARPEAGTEASRLKIINIAVAVEKRIHNLYNLIEKDIISTVHSQNLQIAPYSPVYQ